MTSWDLSQPTLHWRTPNFQKIVIALFQVLQRKAKISGKDPIPDTIFIPITENDHTNTGSSLTFMGSLKSIITNKTLLLRTFNVHYQWFSVIMVYTGTMYIGTKLYGNPHLNFFLSVIPSVPSNFLYLILPDRYSPLPRNKRFC